jgi:uncharacterized protein (TIGR00730 family)
VGKSSVAERLARVCGSPIVVADRIQCFVDLEVTSARTPAADQHGVPRHYLARRHVHDGDLSARSAATSLGYTLGALAARYPFVVVEGGSISLLEAFFGDTDPLPFDWSVDVRRIDDRREHRQRLLQRAHEMLVPPHGGNGLLEELAAAWRVESQRGFVASVNGPEAVVAWCQRNAIDPASLRQAGMSRRVLDELAQVIADAHLVHVEEQEQAFSQLFGASHVRRIETDTLLQETASDAPAQRRSRAPAAVNASRPVITVFCGARFGVSPAYRQQAAEVGRHLAQGGFDIVYGGAKIGCMGALAEGALEAGGRVVGVMPQGMLDLELAHPGITELQVVDSMHQRKAVMAELADAFIALPGGLGTGEELLEMLTWRQLGLHRKPFLLLDVNGFWTDASRSLGHLVEAGFVDLEDVAHVRLCSDARSLVEALTAQWVKRVGAQREASCGRA